MHYVRGARRQGLVSRRALLSSRLLSSKMSLNTGPGATHWFPNACKCLITFSCSKWKLLRETVLSDPWPGLELMQLARLACCGIHPWQHPPAPLLCTAAVYTLAQQQTALSAFTQHHNKFFFCFGCRRRDREDLKLKPCDLKMTPP